MKILDLLKEDRDAEVQSEIADLLLRDVGEKVQDDLTKAEIDVIAQGDDLWELTMEDIESVQELQDLYRKYKLRFAYFDDGSGLARLYSSSRQKLINLLKSFYRTFTDKDLKELEDDNYFVKIR